MALITAIVFCARSQDSVLSVSMSTVHVVFSSAGFKDGGKLCPKTLLKSAIPVYLVKRNLAFNRV